MSRVKIRWQTTEEFEAEVEIDGASENALPEEFDNDDVLGPLEDVLLPHYVACTDRSVLSWSVVRDGEQVDLPDVKAPKHEPEW